MDGTTIALIGALAVGLLLARLFFRPRGPSEKSFRCTRCKAVAQHSNRTINAWRDGKTTFFCNSCHAWWLESQPRASPAKGGARAREARAGSGCLSVLVLAAVIPAAVAACLMFA